MKTELPLFYFRSTICWVDDDPLFLEAASVIFADHYNLKKFGNPKDALHFLGAYQPPAAAINFTREIRESDLYGTNDHHPIDLNIPAVTNLLNMSKKSDEISVLIVDYNMPEMTGLELCEKIKNLPMKKILLTGEGSHELAVNAFNAGLIDKFLKKDHGIYEQLRACVEELNCLYFADATANLTSHIEASRPSPLSDTAFIHFFHDWRRSNDIIEFALINKQGSFVAKDSAGEVKYFIVMSEYERNEFLKLHDDIEIEDAKALLSQLAKGKMIPFFGIGKESWQVDVGEWRNCFYPAEVMEGRERYYWVAVG